MSLYRNYEARNNVKSELYAPISSLATTVQVATWQWDRWWNIFPMLATLENVDTNGVVQKREIVEITARSWDILTIVRKFAPCLASDTANTQWATSFSFNAGDTISNYIAKEYLDKINEAIDDLYDNWDERIKAIPTWWLWIEITDWNVRVGSEEFYFAWWTTTLNNNATNYVMLDWAWQIIIDTTWRNQKYVKVATIITSWWIITDIKQWKMDAIWWEIWWWWWFKNISNCVYSKWLLVYFIADGEEYNLTYEKWRLKTIVSWEKTYTMTYSWWKLMWAVES